LSASGLILLILSGESERMDQIGGLQNVEVHARPSNVLRDFYSSLCSERHLGSPIIDS